MKKDIRLVSLFIFLIALDQFSKLIFIEESNCNKNIAWSIPLAPGFFYLFWITIFLILIYSFLKSQNHFEKIALTFVLSGAISNMVDRVTRGCVIDFIDLKIWPVFNPADIYITIGVVLLIMIYAKYKIQDTKY